MAGTGAAVRDTRKTTPGLRALEKYAVRCGGGVNHRMALGDAALVKDNHVMAAGGIAVDVAGVTTAADDLVAVFAGQAVACLAGTEAAYVAWGREAADGLRAAGAARVVVVSTDGQDWADETFRSGDDAVAFLGRVREALR